ncbi:MAG: PRC-barrel domain-containing protein [Solirubrobacterales bacterium]|nr:PRC-barrel domain-containing protein [Solirubrobacterales bacterium]
MSSSITGDTFKIGAHVDASDGRCGHLTGVIVDPVANSLTHLVVEPGHHEGDARLVALDLVDRVESDRIQLKCTRQQFEQLDEAEDIQFLDADADAFGYGNHASAWPYYGLGTPLGHHPQPIFVDRVPLGEVEIRRGDSVHAKDGLVGTIDGLVIDPADHHVTHVLLQEGHVWGRKQVAIPIDAANRVGDEVKVALTKEEIEALPPVDIKSHGSA